MHVCEARYTFDILVSVKEVVVAWMSETLMPQETFRIRFDGIHWCVSLDVLMEGKTVVHHGRISKISTKRSVFFFLVSVNGLDRSTFACRFEVGVTCNSRFNGVGRSCIGVAPR